MIAVLEVFDRADDILVSTGREDLHALAAELTAARAAVAELIAAAELVWSQCRNGESPDLIALADAITANKGKGWKSAALAHIGGAA